MILASLEEVAVSRGAERDEFHAALIDYVTARRLRSELHAARGLCDRFVGAAPCSRPGGHLPPCAHVVE